MYYVYLIKSIKYGEIYIGSTNNLRHRITNHNNGSEISTRRYRPWQLIYYEAFRSEKDSREREMKLKHHGNAIRELKKRIQRSLKNGGVYPAPKNGAGFTLIELLVVVSIIGILFGVGIVAYNQFNRRQILIQAAKTLKGDFRLAQSKASSGEKDESVCGSGPTSKTLDGWFVIFTNNPTSSYTFYGSCGSIQFGVKTVSLPTNVSFNPVPDVIQFKPLAQGVLGATPINLTAFSGSQMATVTVTPSGDIY